MKSSGLVVASLSLAFACLEAEPKSIEPAGGTEAGDGDGEGDAADDSNHYAHGDGDGDGDGDEDGGLLTCEENDEWEANDTPESATVITWDDVKPGDSEWTIDAFLCAEEHDWYFVAVEQLPYEFHALYVRAVIEDNNWCDCIAPPLPDAPENAIAVDVFDAETMMLVKSRVSQDGRLYLATAGDAVSHDLLVRVSGPTPLASYSYELNVEIRSFDGEDECEC